MRRHRADWAKRTHGNLANLGQGADWLIGPNRQDFLRFENIIQPSKVQCTPVVNGARKC